MTATPGGNASPPSRGLATIPGRVWRKLLFLRDRFVEKVAVERLLPVYARLRYPRRMRPIPDPASVRSVLVWNVDAIGDLTWTTPTLRALRAGYPAAKITMVCHRINAELLATNPHIDTLVPVQGDRFYSGHGIFARVPEIEREKFDVMLILEMGSRPADAARVLSRRIDVGYSVAANLGLLKHLTDFVLPPNDPAAPLYWPEYFLQTVTHLGLSVPAAKIEIFRTDEDRALIAKWKTEVEADGKSLPLVGLHPTVAAYATLTKQWPLEHFVELARLLHEKRPVRFVLTGSKADRAECETFAGRIREVCGAEVISTAGQFGLRQTVELLSTLDLMVVADTAVLHLSAAAGTATIGLFGATSHQMIAPRNDNCIALSEGLPCSPCFHNRDRSPFWPDCIFPRQECMFTLTPARVAAAAETLLGSVGNALRGVP